MIMFEQLDLLPDMPVPAVPRGLSYRAELLSRANEAALIARIVDLPFAPFQFHGFEGKRRTVSFGWTYRFDGRGLAEAEAIPDWLIPTRAKAAAFAGLAADALVQALIIEYAPGAGIGWHRDRPQFGEVVGLSLGSASTLRFRRRVGAKWERFALPVAPRSAYHLSGEARREWEHGMLPIDELRYAVTFRTLR